MAWNIPKGSELKRRAIHDRYGGNTRAGIVPIKDDSSILLFDTAGGAEYGYNFDGPQGNGTYHYTGEGRRGDQVFTRGNAAIRNYVADGRTLRLFKQTRRTYVKYLGEWALHADPFSIEEAPDREGELRQVIVFRLRSAGESETVDIVNR